MRSELYYTNIVMLLLNVAIFISLFQLKDVGFTHIDYLDDNDALRKKADEKNIHKKFIKCWLGKDKIDAEDSKCHICLKCCFNQKSFVENLNIHLDRHLYLTPGDM